MPRFSGEAEFNHSDEEKLGILLVNLGTPEAPTAPAVRRYLRQFLWDPRVVEQPRWLWWLILNLVILTIRPSRSAAAYQKIWTEHGSPLLLNSQAIADKLGDALQKTLGDRPEIELGMSYGNPAIPAALERLRQRGARQLLVLPLYPQYSATTTASVFDAVTRALQQRRWIPELRFINQYHDETTYISAVAQSIRAHWQQNGRGERLLFSFHGIPQRYFHDGDPYHCQCHKTARLVAEALHLEADDWQLSFQSRVGREPWLMPYTDFTLTDWGRAGVGNIDVVCPGFAADCLETLEEIAMQNAELFTQAGGGALRYVPALNDSDGQISALTDLVLRHTAGWQLNRAARNEERSATARRAAALQAIEPANR